MIEKRRFFCTSTRCGWRFSGRGQPNLCPYCGQQGTVQLDTRRGAQDLIEEIEEIEDQISNRK